MVKTKKPLIFIVTFLVVLVDQLTKIIVKNGLSLGESRAVIKGIFYITHSQNYGASFGLLEGYKWLFILFSVLAVMAVVYYWDKIPKTRHVRVMVALFMAGAIGNLIDRLIYGYVTDFFDFVVWPIFNVADLALTIGCIGLIVYFWKK